MRRFVRFFAALGAVVVLTAGCTSYVTPGSPANLASIDRPDVLAEMARKPAAQFPARIAIGRVQARGYESFSAGRPAVAAGDYSLLLVQELLRDSQIEEMSAWPNVAGAAPLNRLLIPSYLNSLDDLRVSAAKLQADVLVLYTLDTQFEVRRKSVLPTGVISLGIAPDRDAHVTSTASALLIDVRTGFVYGLADATARKDGLASFWGSREQLDQKRIEAEQQAFDQLVVQLEKTWRGIERGYTGRSAENADASESAL